MGQELPQAAPSFNGRANLIGGWRETIGGPDPPLGALSWNVAESGRDQRSRPGDARSLAALSAISTSSGITPPAFQHHAIPPREIVLPRLERPGQHFGDRDRGHGEAQLSGGMSGEKRLKIPPERRMALENGDDGARRRPEAEPPPANPRGSTAPFVAQLGDRRAAVRPNNPVPDPARGLSGCCRAILR